MSLGAFRYMPLDRPPISTMIGGKNVYIHCFELILLKNGVVPVKLRLSIVITFDYIQNSVLYFQYMSLKLNLVPIKFYGVSGLIYDTCAYMTRGVAYHTDTLQVEPLPVPLTMYTLS